MDGDGWVDTNIALGWVLKDYFSFISIKEFMGEEEDSAQKKAERAFDIIDR